MRAPPPIGLGHFTFLDLDPAALVALAARSGYSFVGLRLHPVTRGGLCYALAPGSAAMRALKRQLADDGIGVYDIESVVIDAAFEPQALVPVLDSARELGARRLNCCGDDGEQSRLLANFARLCELAANAGLGVDLECMAWRTVDSIDKAAALLAGAARDNAGLLIDALHLARCGGSAQALAALPDAWLRSVQLCDAPARAPASTEALIAEARAGRLPPGEGALPLSELLTAMPASAVYSVEVPTGRAEEPLARAQHIFEATQRLFAQAGTRN